MIKSKNIGNSCWTRDLAVRDGGIRTKGNQVSLYFSGDEAFESMHQEVRAARRFVSLEMYMFLSDRVGWAMAEALIQKAQEGVVVRVVYDAIGSGEAEEEMFEEMRAAGVVVLVFRPVAPWRKRSGILGRNHRKNLVIDGRVAFTGGMNLGEVWSRKAHGEEAWRDTHMRLEGPAAAGCQEVFREAWEKAGGGAIAERCIYECDEVGPGESECVIIGGRGRSRRRAIRRLYSKAFAEARESAVMTVPYFVPPKRVLNVMRRRALGGMRVEVLVPQNSDVALADWVREGLYPSLMDDGVTFHEYTASILHAKSMVLDDRLAIVGSANFDYFSLAFNWELAVVIDDPQVVHQLIEQYRLDLKQSERVDWDSAEGRPWWRRVLAWIGAGIIRRL